MVGRFEALDCKKCGGNLFDVNGEIYKCVYCQTSHVFINDVFVQQSEFEKEELLQTADALLKWRDYLHFTSLYCTCNYWRINNYGYIGCYKWNITLSRVNMGTNYSSCNLCYYDDFRYALA